MVPRRLVMRMASPADFTTSEYLYPRKGAEGADTGDNFLLNKKALADWPRLFIWTKE